MAFDVTQHAGAGLNEIPSSESLPFLRILQPLSAEVNASHEQHAIKQIEGARAGDIVFNATGNLVNKPFEAIPLALSTCYAEWKPKNAGGGLVDHHPLTIVSHPDYRKVERKEFLGPNELNYTIYLMLTFRQDDEWHNGIIAFSRAFLRAVRKFSAELGKFRYPEHPDIQPPIFARTIEVKSVLDKNDKGSWFTWDLEFKRVLDFTEDEQLLTYAAETRKEAIASLPALSGSSDAAIEDDSTPF